MGAFTVSNKVDCVVNVNPPVTLVGAGAQAGLNSYSGAWRAVRCKLTGSSSYATGGDTLPDVGLKTVEGLLVIAQDDAAINTDGNSIEFRTSGANQGKVKAYSGGTNTEVAAATNLTGASWEVLILGR